eukprot:gnl/Dysnectes_brevis/524_a580_2302.p1 GENE.gnl/Dysnectes_brevis/524_a580_2302~~gnl/Dysnectes_brevis/524_a580_2302.p1  ORF type:complete len:277 (+),score=71.75 gnl/Dysnectes_brevis/524_a580_2302:503-1333(+)
MEWPPLCITESIINQLPYSSIPDDLKRYASSEPPPKRTTRPSPQAIPQVSTPPTQTCPASRSVSPSSQIDTQILPTLTRDTISIPTAPQHTPQPPMSLFGAPRPQARQIPSHVMPINMIGGEAMVPLAILLSSPHILLQLHAAASASQRVRAPPQASGFVNPLQTAFRPPPELETQQSRKRTRGRLVWSRELHMRFLAAVMALGVRSAMPRAILQLMNVQGVTRENVASHLQKFRLALRRDHKLADSDTLQNYHLPKNLPPELIPMAERWRRKEPS